MYLVDCNIWEENIDIYHLNFPKEQDLVLNGAKVRKLVEEEPQTKVNSPWMLFLLFQQKSRIVFGQSLLNSKQKSGKRD